MNGVEQRRGRDWRLAGPSGTAGRLRGQRVHRHMALGVRHVGLLIVRVALADSHDRLERKQAGEADGQGQPRVCGCERQAMVRVGSMYDVGSQARLSIWGGGGIIVGGEERVRWEELRVGRT